MKIANYLEVNGNENIKICGKQPKLYSEKSYSHKDIYQ